MSETKIKVPEGMLEAVYEKRSRTFCITDAQNIKVALEAALRWQRDNAPLPSAEFVAEFMKRGWSVPPLALRDFGCRYARRMYDAPEPEEKQEIDHRWNVQIDGNGQVCICRGNHERSQGCQWEEWPPKPPVPEIPEAIKELFWERNEEYPTEADRIATEGHNAGILEAYRRGQQSK
jgi:hypothetical protein